MLDGEDAEIENVKKKKKKENVSGFALSALKIWQGRRTGQWVNTVQWNICATLGQAQRTLRTVKSTPRQSRSGKYSQGGENCTVFLRMIKCPLGGQVGCWSQGGKVVYLKRREQFVQIMKERPECAQGIANDLTWLERLSLYAIHRSLVFNI